MGQSYLMDKDFYSINVYKVWVTRTTYTHVTVDRATAMTQYGTQGRTVTSKCGRICSIVLKSGISIAP